MGAPAVVVNFFDSLIKTSDRWDDQGKFPWFSGFMKNGLWFQGTDKGTDKTYPKEETATIFFC
jgi:hypothetical protein